MMLRRLIRRTARLCGLLAACAPALAGPALARGLTVATRDGLLGAAMRQVYFDPFTKDTAIPVASLTWDGRLATLQAKIGGGDAGWDLVQMPGEETLIGCTRGWLQKIDWVRLGGKSRYEDRGVSDCGVGAGVFAYVLAWDRDKFQGMPTWADFWDVAKYPGKRGLRRGAKTNLEIALLADGVAPSDIYRTLATKDGLERAFRKLDQLKPYVVWWQTPAEAAHILGSGEVLMTSAPNIRITDANRAEHRNFGIQWKQSLSEVSFWAIPKGNGATDAAYSLLGFVGEPQREAALQALVPYGGLAKGANARLSQEQKAISPATQAHLQESMPIDQTFWRDNLAKLDERFEAWLEK
ncbi:MAG TPA: extracellular solute-binding protein [Acetobacteraceae bacterium]|nr:extracellular solute-binding protein [Acetobacteraceae bacterium]